MQARYSATPVSRAWTGTPSADACDRTALATRSPPWPGHDGDRHLAGRDGRSPPLATPADWRSAVSVQLTLDLNGARSIKAARPFGPWPVDTNGCVRVPVVDRRSGDGISWTLVDAQDYALGMSRLWYRETSGYAITHSGGAGRRVALHSMIMPPLTGLVVDHVHGDRLDNRRAELRYVTNAQNSANRTSPRVGRSSQYRGVTLHRQTGRWQAAAKHHDRCYYVGLYRTEAEAAAAYDRLAAKLWPGIVPPNLPTSITELPVKRTITFQHERATKGALRYRELDAAGNPIMNTADAQIGVLYLRKSTLAGETPERVTVTITTEAA